MIRLVATSILALGLTTACANKDAAKEAAQKAAEAQDQAVAAQTKANEEARQAAVAQDKANAETGQAINAQNQADVRANESATAAGAAADAVRQERDALLAESASKLRAFDERLAVLEARAAKDQSPESKAWMEKVRASRARMDELTREALAASAANWATVREQITTFVTDLQVQLDWAEKRWTK